MARNERTIRARPDEIFDLLSDARGYGHWVVGSKEIRDVDAGFPGVGTRFHHRVGVGPFTWADHTEVLACERPRRLRLRAKVRPFGTALVTIELFAMPDGTTKATLVEDGGDPLSKLLFLPLTHLLVRGRNVESLRRLQAMAEGRGPTMEQAARGE
ncbi:MAG: SRPBCC family protein [Solirubrobacterales bacterium]|nr:SRPBCC family protein [Solirubrobacterales bacterium]